MLDIYVSLNYDYFHRELVGTAFRRVLWSRTDDETRQYVGSNALGVRVRVTESFSRSYRIAANNWQDFPLANNPKEEGGGRDSIHVAIPSEPFRARRLKESVAAVALCRLVEPFIITTYDSTEATINSPFAYREKSFFLTVELVELWIYDRFSGIVLSKIRPKN